jgi:nucleoside-diphosphate-sugar epimerase
MKALVTGGGGFLGCAIVRRLVERGDQVRSLSRGDYPQLKSLGVEQFQADLADLETLARAAKGCDVVFHVAAKAGIWGPYAEYHRVNVTGTENVLAACRRAGVRRLIYTSSPSVVFNGQDMEGADESAPYPALYHAAYPETKAKAEQLVLQASGPELATVALRPHLIWGPGDNHLIPRLVARARAGRLRRIGKKSKLVDTVYIDNAADAQLLAADRLTAGSAVAGKAYFIAQGEPLPLWDLINRILDAAGLPPVTRRIPATVAYAAGGLCEALWTVLGRQTEPPMTRFLARELSTAHWFNLEAARRDLGYRPSVSVDEGLRRLRESFQQGTP